MTIRFLKPWNGYQPDQVATLAGGVETTLIDGGIAVANTAQGSDQIIKFSTASGTVTDSAARAAIAEAAGGGGGSELSTAVATSRALTADDDQKTLKVTASGVTLTLPEGLLISTLVIPHSGGTSIDPTGAVTLNSAGTTLSATTGVICIIPEAVANAYRVTGAA